MPEDLTHHTMHLILKDKEIFIMEKEKEMNDRELKEVVGGYDFEMRTYQEYCPMCGYVFYEEKYHEGMAITRPAFYEELCPQCHEFIHRTTRDF